MASLAALRDDRIAGRADIVVTGEIDQLAAADDRAVVGDPLVDAEIGIAQPERLRQVELLPQLHDIRGRVDAVGFRRGFPPRLAAGPIGRGSLPRYFSTAAMTCRVVSSSGRISWGNRPPNRSSSEARISIRSSESRPVSAIGESSVMPCARSLATRRISSTRPVGRSALCPLLRGASGRRCSTPVAAPRRRPPRRCGVAGAGGRRGSPARPRSIPRPTRHPLAAAPSRGSPLCQRPTTSSEPSR